MWVRARVSERVYVSVCVCVCVGGGGGGRGGSGGGREGLELDFGPVLLPVQQHAVAEVGVGEKHHLPAPHIGTAASPPASLCDCCVTVNVWARAHAWVCKCACVHTCAVSVYVCERVRICVCTCACVRARARWAGRVGTSSRSSSTYLMVIGSTSEMRMRCRTC